jgi:proline iminopeptidase
MKKLILITVAFVMILILSQSIKAQNIVSQYQKINSNGLDIYYRIFGEGYPILIIGGGPGDTSDRYLSLCELLSKEFQCVLVEQRGCGKSAPAVYDSSTVSIALTLEDFEALRNHLGIKQWTALGFSYGGYLASLYAHFYPSSIVSLILMDSMGLNTNVFGHFIDNINSKLQATDLDLFEYWNDSSRVAQNPKHALVERIRARMPGYFYDRKKSLIVSEEMKDSHFNFEVGQLIWPDIVKRNLDLAEMECNYNGAILILHGRQDPLGESVAQELHRYYKNSKLIFVEKAGHYSWVEQPEKIFSSIKEFLQGSK